MEIKTFKKTINDVLILNNFKKTKNYYYYYLKDLVIVIGLQKSNYSNGYYVNLGYIIYQLKGPIENPRDVDGDVRARFSFEKDGKKIGFFDLDESSHTCLNDLETQIRENVKYFVEPVKSLENLKSFLQKNPVHLYQTSLIAKRLLGFEI